MTPPEQRNKRDWKTTAVFQDISRDACAFLEAACNIRYFEQEQIMKDNAGKILDRWTSIHSVQVKPVARHFGNCGVAEYVIADGYTERDFEYFKRCGMKPKDVQRPPRSGDWHGFLPTEIAEGGDRVIVNLDTLEYLNPAKFGQMPTLAGMVTLAPKDRELPVLKRVGPNHHYLVDVAGALFAMLCHPQRRGGDIPANAAEMDGIDAESCSKASKTSNGAGAAPISLEPAKSATRNGRPPKRSSGEGPTSATRPSAILPP